MDVFVYSRENSTGMVTPVLIVDSATRASHPSAHHINAVGGSYEVQTCMYLASREYLLAISRCGSGRSTINTGVTIPVEFSLGLATVHVALDLHVYSLYSLETF